MKSDFKGLIALFLCQWQSILKQAHASPLNS